MPWKVICAMDERLKFISKCLVNEGRSISSLCREFGISRKTGYKWLKRYKEKGLSGLEEASRAPHSNPRSVSAPKQERILEVREQFPWWGPVKILDYLQSENPETSWPSTGKIGEILKEAGLVKRRKQRRSIVQTGREDFSEMHYPNQVWSVDFKGPLLTTSGEKCIPLTVSDGASRYLLDCRIISPDADETWKRFELLFRNFGLPEAIRSDNGPPFSSNSPGGLNKLSIRWVKLGIKLERIRPGHPEENGRHERLHRTMKEYLKSKGIKAASPQEYQKHLDNFSYEYNQLRSHNALNHRTPEACYHGSTRFYTERIPEPDYPENYLVRRVRSNGQIKLDGKLVFISQGLIKEKIGLTKEENGSWRVYFSNHELGIIDSEKYVFKKFVPILKNKIVPKEKYGEKIAFSPGAVKG